MRRSRFHLQSPVIPALLVGVMFTYAVPLSAQPPTIEGTYRLTSRKLPDGKVQNPPDIMGLLTFTKTHRNFNVFWKDAQGKVFSYSIVSTYSLTEKEYTETILYSILNDEIGGKKIAYELSKPTQTVPVKREGGRLQFKLPFDPPSVVIEGNKLTATAEGRFVDYWEKIQ